jgi:acetyl/propionyl-CoA carboxylase alpha subunit
LPKAFTRAAAEAKAAFGNGALYAERLVRQARHIEVQVVGDGKGVVALGERECSLQRRSQKIVELAPSPGLKPALRKKIVDAAVAMARAVKYRSLGTFEFLVDGEAFFFIEANPRLQVEHTVTEEVWGVDLVQAQLRGVLPKAEGPQGCAIQLRVNMETMTEDGSAKPGGGTLSVFEPPSGPGVRVDTYGYAGYRTNPNFDSLLAKVIVKAADLRRGAGAGRPGAGLVPAGGRAVEHRLPARAARRQGRAGGQGAHALCRPARPAIDRRGGEAERRSVFPDGGAGGRRRGRPAPRSMRSIRWRCWRSARPLPAPLKRADLEAHGPKRKVCRCRRQCRAPSSASR